MFRDTRRKKIKNRIIITLVCVFVLSLGIYLNNRPEGELQNTAKEVKVEESDKKNTRESTEEDTKQQRETYLVKEVNGVVKVFLCRGDSYKELYLITSIPFELLSESDQELFRDGVSIESEDKLGRFLENFDS